MEYWNQKCRTRLHAFAGTSFPLIRAKLARSVAARHGRQEIKQGICDPAPSSVSKAGNFLKNIGGCVKETSQDRRTSSAARPRGPEECGGEADGRGGVLPVCGAPPALFSLSLSRRGWMVWEENGACRANRADTGTKYIMYKPPRAVGPGPGYVAAWHWSLLGVGPAPGSGVTSPSHARFYVFACCHA
jgi:hypothetical protein